MKVGRHSVCFHVILFFFNFVCHDTRGTMRNTKSKKDEALLPDNGDIH